ncbi:hypothetical protein B0H13DRAFT_2008342 [Mycena leptocephala]|nr:hypothetical protein B0H13DRAFT_2118042 [Mycena leptocephala]KAJ7912044.1 hypothetical protein B0H13DRAFT_2008342 [Mycena leptocephala]
MDSAKLGRGYDGTLILVMIKAEALRAFHRTRSTRARGLEGSGAAAAVDDKGKGRGHKVFLPGLDRVVLQGRRGHIKTNGVLTLGCRAASSGHPDLTGLDFRIFKQNTHGEGDVVGLGNAVVVLLDKLDGFAISDEFLEEGGNEFGAGEAVR